jgi:hypothetical protein
MELGLPSQIITHISTINIDIHRRKKETEVKNSTKKTKSSERKQSMTKMNIKFYHNYCNSLS